MVTVCGLDSHYDARCTIYEQETAKNAKTVWDLDVGIYLGFGRWDLLGIWSLGFGISHLV